MSYSHKKMDVRATMMPEYDNKYWVICTLLLSRKFVPSFQDLFRIVRAICWCEDAKYPKGRGRRMVADFMRDSCEAGDDEELWAKLQKKYKIPEREDPLT